MLEILSKQCHFWEICRILVCNLTSCRSYMTLRPFLQCFRIMRTTSKYPLFSVKFQNTA